MPDGSLRISTKIDNSQLDKGLQETKKQIDNQVKELSTLYNNAGKEVNKLNLKVEETAKNHNILKERLSNVRQEMDKIVKEYKTKNTNSEGKLVINPKMLYDFINTDLDFNELGEEETKLVRKSNELAKNGNQYAQQLEAAKQKQQIINIKLEEAKQKQNEYNKKIEQSKEEQLELNSSTQAISKPINKGITKILKYGMALLSIRSIYGMLSDAMNNWLSGNSKGAKQIKSDIDYMKNAIGGALSPILKYIVNLLYQALGFTGALIKAFTGVDIFAGSVADYMKSTTSSASKTNKELKKQIASFDKINKLNDNESNANGGGSGVVAPSQDLSSIMEKYTEQAENLKKCFEEIKDIVIAIGLGIGTWKLLETLGVSTGLSLSLGIMATSLSFFWQGVKGFQDGEITDKDIFNTIAGIIGLGVVTFIGASSLGLAFSVSAPMAISVILFFADWAIASYGQSQTPSWVQDLFGFTDISGAGTGKNGANLMEKLGIPENVRFNISITFYFIKGMIDGLEELFPGVKSTLLQRLKEMLWDVADEIEKIPIIGQTIANGIRGAIQLSGKDMTKTLEETTTNSIETAKTKINEKSLEAGGEAGTNWMSEMKNKIDTEKKSLQTTIEETISDASNNSNNEVEQQGKDMGENYIDATKEQIEQSKESLSNSIMQTTNEATDRASNSTQESGIKLGGKTIDGIKLGQSSQTNSLSNNISDVVREANNNVDTSSSNSIGSNIVSGINSGVNNNKWSLFSTMTSLGNRLLNNFKTTLGIHSPSREMASLAKFIPLGIAEGIDSTENKAIGSMKNLVCDLEDTMSEMDYSNITEIPKISKNAISYVPKQSISTNEIQRSIVGTDDNVLNKILPMLQSNSKGSKTITIPLIIDGEEFIRKTIQLNNDYNLATNGGGL